MFFEGFAANANANKRLEGIFRDTQCNAGATSEANKIWALQQSETTAMLFRGKEGAHAFFGQCLDLLFEAACTKLKADDAATEATTALSYEGDVAAGCEDDLNSSSGCDGAPCKSPQNTLIASSRSREQLLGDTAVVAMQLLTGRHVGSPRVMQCVPVEAYAGTAAGNTFGNRRSPWGDMGDCDGARANMVSFVASGKAMEWIDAIQRTVSASMHAIRRDGRDRQHGQPALHRHDSICVTRLVRSFELLEAILLISADVLACGAASPQRRTPFADASTFPPPGVATEVIAHGTAVLLDAVRDVCAWVAPEGSCWVDVSTWLVSHVYATEEKWVELQYMAVDSDEVHMLLLEATGVLQALACRNELCGATVGSLLHRRLLRRRGGTHRQEEDDALCDPLAPCLSAVLTVPFLQLFPTLSVGEKAVCAFLSALVFDDATNKHCGSNAPWTAIAHRLFGLPSRRWLACGFNYSGTGVWLLDEICAVNHRRSFPPLGHGEGVHMPSTEGMTPRILQADEVDKEQRLAPIQPLDMLGSPMSTSFDANLFSSEAPLTVGGILGQLAEAYLLRSTTDTACSSAQEGHREGCTEADVPLWRRGAPTYADTTDRAQTARWLLQERCVAEACTLHRIKRMRCILRASELHRFAFLEAPRFDSVAASVPRRRRQLLAVLLSELPVLLRDWHDALDPMKAHEATSSSASHRDGGDASSSSGPAAVAVVAVTSPTVHQLLLMAVEFALCLMRASWVHRKVLPVQQHQNGTRSATDADSDGAQVTWIDEYCEEYDALRNMTVHHCIPLLTKVAAATGSACQSPKRRACFGQLTSSIVRLVSFSATLWLRPGDPSDEAATSDDLRILYPSDARRQIASTYGLGTKSDVAIDDGRRTPFAYWKESVDALSTIRCSLLALRTSATDEVASFAHRLQSFLDAAGGDAMLCFPEGDDAFAGTENDDTSGEAVTFGAPQGSAPTTAPDLFAAWDVQGTDAVQHQERILTLEEAAAAAVPTAPVYDEEQRHRPDGAGIRHQRTPSDHTRVLTPTRGIVGGAFDLFAMAPVVDTTQHRSGAPS